MYSCTHDRRRLVICDHGRHHADEHIHVDGARGLVLVLVVVLVVVLVILLVAVLAVVLLLLVAVLVVALVVTLVGSHHL